MKKTVLVTGGTVRLGKCIADYLRETGWEVFTTSHRSDAGADFVLDYCDNAKLDMKVPVEVMAACLDDTPFDALVNNVGIFEPTGFEIYDDDHEKIDFGLFRVNHMMPTLFSHSLVEQGMLRKPGAIVNVLDANVFGREKIKKSDYYLYSKHLFSHQTLDDAKRFAPDVRVNGVAPGSVFPPEGVHMKAAKRLSQRAPEGRDVAKAVAFLLENESINGAILPVDGGQVNRVELQKKHIENQLVKEDEEW